MIGTEIVSDGASTVCVDRVVAEVSETGVAVPEDRVTSQATWDALVALDPVDLSGVFSCGAPLPLPSRQHPKKQIAQLFDDFSGELWASLLEGSGDC